MFGMSGAEIMILLVVGIVVVGPKRLPGMMRTAGQWVAKVRRMTSNVRENTGIDRIIREEGLEKEIRELQSLARSPVIQSLLKATPAGLVTQALSNAASAASAPLPPRPPPGASTPSIASSLPSSTGAAASTAASVSSVASSVELQQNPTAAATASDVSAAASLIRPAEGTVARGSDQALAVLKSQGFFSFREREYPTMGCDAYDALPDDLDDPDAYPDEDPAVFGPPPDDDAAPVDDDLVPPPPAIAEPASGAVEKDEPSP